MFVLTTCATDMAPAIPRPELDEPLVLTSNATRVLSRLGLEDLVAKAHAHTHTPLICYVEIDMIVCLWNFGG
jgi:hypothetical protein